MAASVGCVTLVCVEHMALCVWVCGSGGHTVGGWVYVIAAAGTGPVLLYGCRELSFMQATLQRLRCATALRCGCLSHSCTAFCTIVSRAAGAAVLLTRGLPLQ